MWRFAFVTMIFVISACESEKSIEELAAKHRDDVEAKFTSLRAIAERVDEISPVTENAYEAVEPEPKSPGRRNRDRDGELLPYNTAVVHEEHLALMDTWESPNLPVEVGRTSHIPYVWRVIERIEDGEEGEERHRELFKQVSWMRYVVVLRTLQARAPVVTGEHTFEGGSFEGEALVFTLDGGEYLGGFRFAAQNDDQIRAHSSVSDLTLETDLKNNAREVLQAGLAQYARAP